MDENDEQTRIEFPTLEQWEEEYNKLKHDGRSILSQFLKSTERCSPMCWNRYLELKKESRLKSKIKSLKKNALKRFPNDKEKQDEYFNRYSGIPDNDQ